uniref:Major facilitator superfamily (MFS) profile domain-containing protein n=2 Tax=Acrobeloides nanus TaxID=290746 RepID=A0A914C6I4_9BILA
MVNSTALEEPTDGNSSVPKKSACERSNLSLVSNEEKVVGEFLWSKNTQGGVLSAFFWGYMSSQILAGYLASRYGGRLVIGVTVLGGALITLLSPLAANLNVYTFIGLRAILGFFQGSTFPAMHHLWSVWAPPLERSLLTGISYAGAQIGNVLVMPISGLLCKYGFAGGWPSIFYILGAFGLLWCILWFCFVADSPQKHRSISEKERNYIVGSLRESGGKDTDHEQHREVPWGSILTSLPVWACFVGHFAGDWGAYMMATSLPSFMNDVLGFDLTSMGFITSIPYLVYFFFINLGGFVADKLQGAKVLSTLNTRRLAMLTALGFQALFLVLIGYCKCGQETLVIVLLTLSVGISGLQYAGFVVNYLDIAPTFAGPILGIGNTLSCCAGILAPLLMGWMTPTGSKEEWRLVFYVTAAILVFGAVFFSIFASGEVQQWAMAKSNLLQVVDEPLLSDSKQLKSEKENIGDA